MNQSSLNTVVEDLAYVRGVAEEGRKAPLLGGRFFVLWGLVVAVGSLANWAVFSGAVSVPSWSVAIIWFSLAGAASVLNGVLGRKLEGKPGSNSIGNQVEKAVWSIAGVIFFTLAIAFLLFSLLIAEKGSPLWGGVIFSVFPPITFGIYAIALKATSVASSMDQLKIFVWLSVLFAILTTLLIGSLFQFFATTAGILLVSVLPGVLMIRAEPSEIV